jgi:predicted transcriptional regulator
MPMTALTIHIDEKTEARLRKASEEMARDVHDLAECAVSEAVLDYFRHRQDDPARDNSPRPAGETLQ